MFFQMVLLDFCPKKIFVSNFFWAMRWPIVRLLSLWQTGKSWKDDQLILISFSQLRVERQSYVDNCVQTSLALFIHTTKSSSMSTLPCLNLSCAPRTTLWEHPLNVLVKILGVVAFLKCPQQTGTNSFIQVAPNCKRQQLKVRPL